MTWTIFVYYRCSAHRGAPAAGGMCSISGGSATTGHMLVLQGSHTAQLDLLAESRAKAVLLRAASWAPWRSWGGWTRQVRQRWLWNRAGQHCSPEHGVDTLQGPHSAFKEGFDWAAQLLASLCDCCPLAKWDKHLPRCCHFSTHYNKARDFC